MNHLSQRFLWLCLLLLLNVTAAAAQTVYTTKTGKKYHSDNCRYLSQSKIQTTLSEAKAAGYTACSVCSPTTTVTETRSSETSTLKKAVSTQCTGTTKAGARCKRMTLSANGRCYQH